MPGARGDVLARRQSLSTLLPPAHLAAAPPLRLLEGHWDNLGTPQLCSSSSKPPFVPKQALVRLPALVPSCSVSLI